MEKIVSLENITEQEFKYLLNLDRMPDYFEEFDIFGIKIKNISMNGEGIVEGTVFGILLELASDVVISLFSSFLYDKIMELNKNKKNNIILKIDNKLVDGNKKENIEKELSKDEK